MTLTEMAIRTEAELTFHRTAHTVYSEFANDLLINNKLSKKDTEALQALNIKIMQMFKMVNSPVSTVPT